MLLLVAHIAVLGYWLGSEFVINSTYRFVCYRTELDLDVRTRLMEHVMNVDQHVRYALVLQTTLGLMLAASYGYVPGGDLTAMVVAVIAVFWLGFVELVHRMRHQPSGQLLATIDRALRYVLMIVLLIAASGWFSSVLLFPGWMRWKLGLFAAVMFCGVGIRFALIGHFSTWAKMQAEGTSAHYNAIIQKTYVRATSILVLLWVCIFGIVALSVMKPV
jgi:hypothetical protein